VTRGCLPETTEKARRLASTLRKLGYSWPEALAMVGPSVGERSFRAAKRWVGGRGQVRSLRRDAGHVLDVYQDGGSS